MSIELKDLKPTDAQVKLDELNNIEEATRTDEQKTDIQALEGYVNNHTEYLGLSKKPEGELTDDETQKLLDYGEMFGALEGKEKPGAAGERNWAGIYKTVEDFINGIRNSDEGIVKVFEELAPEQQSELENYYKDNQKLVSKITDIKKKAAPKVTPKPKIDVSTIPLAERRPGQITNEEYSKWEGEDKMAAQTWLNKSTNLSVAQGLSTKKVFKKYGNWRSEIAGDIEPSKEIREFDRIWDTGKYLDDPNGQFKCMEEMEVNLGTGKPKKEPPKKPVKPGMPQGPAGGGGSPSGGSGKLTPEEFEKLSPEEQDAYMEKDVMSTK